MNIDQYRAMVAAEKAAAEQKPDDTKPTETQVEPTTPIPETIPNTPEPTLPDKVTIDGIGEISVAELKNGYLRGRDYTQKTQELARLKREMGEATNVFQQIQRDPELMEQLKGKVVLPDPAESENRQLKSMLYDLKLEVEIERLKAKHGDFDEVELLTFANEKRLNNMEDAFQLLQATKAPSTKDNVIDLEAERKRLRAEIEAELKKEDATTSIIASNAGLDKNDDTPRVTKAEVRVANIMFRDKADPVGEYIKWRGAGKKPSPK